MKRGAAIVAALAALAGLSAESPSPPAATFSIVARDAAKDEWGVAVASKVMSVGAVVPWAKADAGAIATQSFANVTYGPRGLLMLAKGMSAKATLDDLIADDPRKESRQAAIVDARGGTASFTGGKCFPWAGAKAGDGFSCQGNMLKGPEVIDAMVEAFAKAKGPLAWRLAAALEAGDRAGGDKRGKQSAALVVVRDRAGYGGLNDRLIDLRVDDHDEPVAELLRILGKAMPRPEKK